MTIKIFKWLFVIVFLFLTSILFLRNARLTSDYKQAKRDFDLTLAKKEARIGQLENEETQWRREAERNLKKADESAAESERFRREAAREKEENKKLQEAIAVMPVDEIVSQFRLRLALGEGDIYRNQLGIQFSIAAGRKALQRIGYADYFSLIEEPRYMARLEEKDKEIGSLRTTIKDQKEALAASDAIKVENKQIKIDYAELLKKSERQAKFLRFTIGGTTVAIVAVGLVFFLKR